MIKNKIQIRKDLNLTAAYSLASHPLKTLLRKQAKIKILTVNVKKSNSSDLVIIFSFICPKTDAKCTPTTATWF